MREELRFELASATHRLPMMFPISSLCDDALAESSEFADDGRWGSRLALTSKITPIMKAFLVYSTRLPYA